MDLIGQVDKKKVAPNRKKAIIILLITLTILALFLVVIIMALVQNAAGGKFKLVINSGKEVVSEIDLSGDVFITSEDGKTYISLKDISYKIGSFTYYNGDYLAAKSSEDNNFCYLENQFEIIGFKSDSNIIYKTTRASEIDPEYFELTSKVIMNNNKLYVCIDDLQLACNVIVSREGNQFTIYSLEALAEKYDLEMEDPNMPRTIVEEYNNRKAMAYNMMMTKLDNRVGVLNAKLEWQIGNKYSSLKFNEINKTFIAVELNNKVGVIDSNGATVIESVYDSIRIINYEPLLYEVELNNKYGVIDANLNMLIPIEYSALGYKSRKPEQASVLIIPNIYPEEDGKNDLPDVSAIVVIKDNKCGLIDIATGEVIIKAKLVDAIYTQTEDTRPKEEKSYYGLIGNNPFLINKTNIDIIKKNT